MKKLLKNRLVIFIISGFIFGSIGVYAANVYQANKVNYMTYDGTETTVEKALNDLYQNKGILIPTLTYDSSTYGRSPINGSSLWGYFEVDRSKYDNISWEKIEIGGSGSMSSEMRLYSNVNFWGGSTDYRIISFTKGSSGYINLSDYPTEYRMLAISATTSDTEIYAKFTNLRIY